MTLLELMFSIFVASILLTIAVPSFDWLMEKERLKGAAVRLAAETRQARAEAQSSGDAITVIEKALPGGMANPPGIRRRPTNRCPSDRARQCVSVRSRGR